MVTKPQLNAEEHKMNPATALPDDIRRKLTQHIECADSFFSLLCKGLDAKKTLTSNRISGLKEYEIEALSEAINYTVADMTNSLDGELEAMRKLVGLQA